MSEDAEAPSPPSRTPTGIPGLDQILGGGLFKGGIYVAVPDSTGDLPEVPVWCSLLHITAIEPISAKNGRPSRKK